MHVAAWERQFINLQLEFIFTWDLNLESIQIAQLKGISSFVIFTGQCRPLPRS